jgi:hypothetical protein
VLTSAGLPVSDWIKDCRDRLPNFNRKIEACQPVRLLGYGTSVTAIGGPQRDYWFRPNGPHRDILRYYLEKASAEDMLRPVQIGINWSLKDAIETRTGSSVTYLNMAIGGTTAGDGMSRKGRPNGNDPTRIAAVRALVADLIVIEYCVNDLKSADLSDDLTRIIRSLRSSTTDILVLGSIGLPDTRKLDARIRAEADARNAAEECGVAFVPFAPLFDAEGNMTVAAIQRHQLCAANGINHPGAAEMTAYGRWVRSIVISDGS